MLSAAPVDFEVVGSSPYRARVVQALEDADAYFIIYWHDGNNAIMVFTLAGQRRRFVKEMPGRDEISYPDTAAGQEDYEAIVGDHWRDMLRTVKLELNPEKLVKDETTNVG